MEVDKKLEEKVKNILTSDAGYHRKILALEQLRDDEYAKYIEYDKKNVKEVLKEIDQIVGNYNKDRFGFDVTFSCNSSVHSEWSLSIVACDITIGNFGPVEIVFHENKIDHRINFFVGSESWIEGNSDTMMKGKGLLSILYGTFLYRINNKKPIGVCPLNFVLMKDYYNNFLYLQKTIEGMK